MSGRSRIHHCVNSLVSEANFEVVKQNYCIKYLYHGNLSIMEYKQPRAWGSYIP